VTAKMNLTKKVKIAISYGNLKRLNKLSGTYMKYYRLSEHLANKLMCFFEFRVTFKKYILKNHRWLQTEGYKLHDFKGCT
jgi:hypothetical protein